jgi:hypothetical protein
MTAALMTLVLLAGAQPMPIETPVQPLVITPQCYAAAPGFCPFSPARRQAYAVLRTPPYHWRYNYRQQFDYPGHESFYAPRGWLTTAGP